MLECNVILTLLYIIYAHMVKFTSFICVIKIQNTEICTVYHKSAKNTEIWIFAHIAQPYF